MVQILPPLNYLGQSQKKSELGEFFGGLGTGLEKLATQKASQLQKKNESEIYHRAGFRPEIADFLTHVREVDPAHFTQILQGLGSDAYKSRIPQEEVEVKETPRSVSEKVSISKSGPLFEDKEAKKRAHEDQKLINKEVYPYIKEVQSKAKGAKENDIRLNRLEKLIESGKLNNPTFYGALKTLKHGIWGLGLDLTNLLEPESQEFEKLSNDFVKNAKDVFGNRLTDQDLKAFLATVPTLSQTNEGKAAVINNLKLLNKAAELRADAARKLLKHYNNKPPLDFESEVDDLIKPELDAISKSFEQGSSKKVNLTSSLPKDILGGLGQGLLGIS